MAGIASIPPKHLTARAYEWLTKSSTIYGVRYSATCGIAACYKAVSNIHDIIEVSTDYLTHEGWCCGVEDVRAIYLNEPTAVKYVTRTDWMGLPIPAKRDTRKEWKSAPINLPTCIDCLILMDKGMELTGPRKIGKFIRFIKLNNINGKKVMVPTWVAQDGVIEIPKPPPRPWPFYAPDRGDMSEPDEFGD